MLELQINNLRSQTLMLSRQLENQKKISLHLEQKLYINPRSGLPNHLKMENELLKIIDGLNSSGSRPEKNRCNLAAAIIKLDETFGMAVKTMKQSVSDWIVYQIGMRLKEGLQESEKVFHIKDNEFLVLLRDFSSPAHLTTRVEQIWGSVVKPHIFSGHHLMVSCNIGVAIFPQHGSNRSGLLHAADLALGYAIQSRKNAYFYEEKLRHGTLEKMDLHSSIILAIESHAVEDAPRQFQVFFQPQVFLKRRGNDKYEISKIDAEVLIRWNHPRRGAISPEKFIPFAEESGLIHPIGNWVFFQTIAQLEKWRKGPLKDVTLSINISPKQFLNDQLMVNLGNMIKKYPYLRNRLKLEITETTLLENPERSIARMNYLRKLGLRFALDDFGKGYSSLNYLTRLPLQTLKLDRSFISEVGTKMTSAAIIRAVIFLAAKTKLSLICEGVEDKKQMRSLLRLGARNFQGYYFSPALDEKKFAEFYRGTLASPLLDFSAPASPRKPAGS